MKPPSHFVAPISIWFAQIVPTVLWSWRLKVAILRETLRAIAGLKFNNLFHSSCKGLVEKGVLLSTVAMWGSFLFDLYLNDQKEDTVVALNFRWNEGWGKSRLMWQSFLRNCWGVVQGWLSYTKINFFKLVDSWPFNIKGRAKL